MRDLEPKFNTATDLIGIAGLGSVLLSSMLLFTPVKTIGYIGIGGSLATYTTSILTRKKHLKIAEEILTNQDKQFKEKLDNLNTETHNHYIHTKDLEARNKTLCFDIAQLKSENEKINRRISETERRNHDVESLSLKLTAKVEKVLNESRQVVYELIEEWKDKLDSIASRKHESEELTERIKLVVEEGKSLLIDYKQKLNETSTSHDAIADLMSLYYHINNDLTNVKIKAIRAESIHKQRDLLIALDEWENGDFVSKAKLDLVCRNFEVRLREFQMEEVGKLEQFQEFAQAVEGMNQDDDKFVKSLIAKMEELEVKNHQLSKPITYPGATRTDMRIANIVISYFERLGIILDRAGSDYKGYEALLEFIPDRTGRLVLASELNEHSERLQGLTHVLNKPEFKLDGETGLMTLLVRWGNKPKADINDISKLWIPAVKFEQMVKTWSRIRLTGGSESGKSPTAENLAVAILIHRPGIPKLYNPQYDSVKNHWTIPVEGTSHSDSEKGIASLATQVDLRANGHQTRDVFELSIFDEVDSTMSHTKGKKAVIGGNVNFIIKQASHQNLGAIFIGQNANVSEYPGMDRSDWNSAVNVHIGANAYDAIQNSNRFTSDEVTKLKQTADKITEFCNDKNTELGLEKTDPQAYRFALVIEPNKKPYFIELPAFGTYTFDQLQHHQPSSPDVVTVTPDITTQSPEALKMRITNVSPMDIQSGYVGSGCPGCGSANRVRAGKYHGRQRYQCKDCGKRYTEEE